MKHNTGLTGVMDSDSFTFLPFHLRTEQFNISKNSVAERKKVSYYNSQYNKLTYVYQ